MSFKKRFYRIIKVIVLWRISSKAWSKMKKELSKITGSNSSDSRYKTPKDLLHFNTIIYCGIMPTISVNVPEKMREKIEELSENKMYGNTSEYIRDALRKKIEDDTGLTSEEEELVAERLEKMKNREDRSQTLDEVAEELGLE